MYRVLSAFLFSLAIAPAAGLAQTRWIECPGCTEASARAWAELDVAPATRIFFDAGANSAWSFEVEKVPVGPDCQTRLPSDPASGKQATTTSAPGQCQWTTVADRVAMDAGEREILQWLHEAFVATRGTWKSAVQVPRSAFHISPCEFCVDPDGSGYDAVSFVQYRNQVRKSVRQYANSMPEMAGRIARLYQQAVEIMLLGREMRLTLIVQFPDGTKVPVVLDDRNPNGYIDVDHVTDPVGGPIMTSANIDQFRNYSQVFPSNLAVENFLRNAERVGALIEDRGPNNAVSCTWQCTSSENNNADCKLTCRAQ